MKETSRAAERILHEIIPNLASLLDRPVRRDNELSDYYYARQVLEMVEVELKTAKKTSQVLQERLSEIQRTHQTVGTISMKDEARFIPPTLGYNSIDGVAPGESNNGAFKRNSSLPRGYDSKLKEARVAETSDIVSGQTSIQDGRV